MEQGYRYRPTSVILCSYKIPVLYSTAVTNSANSGVSLRASFAMRPLLTLT